MRNLQYRASDKQEEMVEFAHKVECNTAPTFNFSNACIGANINTKFDNAGNKIV